MEDYFLVKFQGLVFEILPFEDNDQGEQVVGGVQAQMQVVKLRLQWLLIPIGLRIPYYLVVLFFIKAESLTPCEQSVQSSYNKIA